MISIPFSGSKRYSYKNVKKIVKENNYKTVYEPFGGSCVLSVNLFNDGLVEKAVANDYDHFFDLYPEYLDLKDFVVDECYKRGLNRTSSDSKRGIYRFTSDGSLKPVKSKVISDEHKKILQGIMKENVPEKYWRYFSYGDNFTHSAVQTHSRIKLTDFTLFNGYLKTDKQRKYLEVLKNITLENLDYRDFLNKYKKDICKNDIVILDPPYIDTAQSQYSSQFSLNDTIELIDNVRSLCCDFIFFNNDIEIVKTLLTGLDFDVGLTGNGRSSANKKRMDVMAFVRNAESEGSK